MDHSRIRNAKVTIPRMFLSVIIIVAGAFLLFGAYLYFRQDRMVFCPTTELVDTPSSLGLSFEEVYVDVAGSEKVHAWYFPAGAARTVLFCHGNGGNISHRLETAEFVTGLGVNILLFDYRGYGRSDGSPSESKVYADAEACYRWLLSEKGVQPQDIVVFGRSLGGAVAIELASLVDCGALVVESSFTSARDMARLIFPYFPATYLLRYKFDSIGKIASAGCPVLVTHSVEDDLIPFAMGRRLFDSAREPKRFVRFYGRHNERDYLCNPSYIEAVRDIVTGQPRAEDEA
ncbi:MAG: alpha/beta hydrolase [candidate division Zixibacteria bacterium]|nr:alpha/beta hydrolase [candidate division Zixibacteria bacterium]